MTPDAVIDTYVSDVAKRLPRAKRNDVALELKALLGEELQGKADAMGRPADETMALELARGFGAPEDVADRYRAPGFTIVPATRSAQFAAIALGGIVLQWAVTLPPVLLHEPEAGRELVLLGQWWLTHGLGALWWPGFMVTAAIIAGWVRHTWPPARQTTWRPRAADTDDINRTAWAFAAAAAACGIAAIFSAQWAMETYLSHAAAAAFAFDPDFLPLGAAVVVFMWALTALESAIVFVEGRWRPLTRKIDLAVEVLWIAVLSWLAFGPRIFLADLTDQATKDWISVVLLLVVIGFGVKIYRLLRRPQAAVALAAITKN